MRIMASTYRDHVIVCGLGHLGIRVIEQLLAASIPCLAMERSKSARFVSRAAELHVPVLIRDMKEDQALVDAGIEDARAIVICANDALANLEVALDARRMNPKIRVVMRLFDEQIVHKLSDAMDVDVAFSSSTLAAPIVAALALQGGGGAGANHNGDASPRVISSMMIGAEVMGIADGPIGGACHVAAELTVAAGHRLVGRRVDELERAHAARLLARTSAGGTQSPPPHDAVIAAGDRLVVHTAASNLASLS